MRSFFISCRTAMDDPSAMPPKVDYNGRAEDGGVCSESNIYPSNMPGSIMDVFAGFGR